MGRFINGEVALNYLLIDKYDFYCGVHYEMSYGVSPAEYEVRYGIGNNYDIYDSYQYNDSHVAWRHAVKIKI